MVTLKDMSDKCIEVRNKKNILWHFIHQIVKGDAMINSKCSCIWTVAEEVNGCFTRVSTKSASRIRYPFEATWVDTTALDFAQPCAISNIMFAGPEEPSDGRLFN